jgi:hypothetical protein
MSDLDITPSPFEDRDFDSDEDISDQDDLEEFNDFDDQDNANAENEQLPENSPPLHRT